jgi:hypothetical protein
MCIRDRDCGVFIEFFNQLKKSNLTRTRQQINDMRVFEKDDEAAFVTNSAILNLPESELLPTGSTVSNLIAEKIFICYGKYVGKYGILKQVNDIRVEGIKIQRTDIGGGYHVWHFENGGGKFSDRFLAWTVYLNNVQLGGETEFLYQNDRQHSVAGSVVLWPAGFTHPHRGNPPLSNEKYIATGWLRYVN